MGLPGSHSCACIALNNMLPASFLEYECLLFNADYCFIQVGPTYGRKTMVGVLSAQGVCAGVNRVGRSLAWMDPIGHSR